MLGLFEIPKGLIGYLYKSIKDFKISYSLISKRSLNKIIDLTFGVGLIPMLQLYSETLKLL